MSTVSYPWSIFVFRFEGHANREVLAASDDCGNPIQFKRIVNGNDSFLGQFPWLANLGYQVGKLWVQLSFSNQCILLKFDLTSEISLPRFHLFIFVFNISSNFAEQILQQRDFSPNGITISF